MKIREIVFNNFRSFRGEHRISFVNPVTQEVNPVTVLAGSNGSGKTTVLTAIEDLLGYVMEPNKPSELLREAMADDSFIGMEIELSAQDLSETQGTASDTTEQHTADTELRAIEVLYIAVGIQDLAPKGFEIHKQHLVCQLRELVARRDSPREVRRGWKMNRKFANVGKRFQNAVSRMHKGASPLAGGLLLFPHDRRLELISGGPIEPPPEERQWRFHFSSSNRWQGSLEQFWVWQNYLDLEADGEGSNHLAKFVDSVKYTLGEDRTITVRQGRVRVAPDVRRSSNTNDGDKVLGPKWLEPGVRLDQLPSGEQQVLLLFGELARRRRPGAVIAIDEIENSLHPTLQRLVMWNLHQIARDWDAQIIVTTHSLEVIHAVRGSAFVNLDYPDDRFDLPVADL